MLEDTAEAKAARKPLPGLRTSDLPPTNLAPSRSRTDPPAPQSHKHEKSHLARRLHSNSLRSKPTSGHHHHHYRHSAKETVQSAIELRPPISFDSLLRRDKKTPDSGRNGSGNQQNITPRHRRNDTYDGTAEQAKPVVRPIDVKLAQENNAKREKELRSSLQNAEKVAMSSTRQLDDTYYTILDKASLLRSTVANLQQLADESRQMDALFQERTGKLQEDTRGLVQSFDNFNAQGKTITELVEQLKASKTQTAQLNDRLEAARNRVEAYEQREKVKATNRRKRWSAIWGALVGILMLIVAFVVARNRSEVGSRVHGVVEVMDRLGSELRASVTALNPMPSHSEDPYLKKLFDEI